MKSRTDLYEFLNNYKIGVLSTVSSVGKPNAAIIGFGQTKDFEIIFGTENSSQKYQNLQRNQQVALTVGGDTAETIQLHGVARELTTDEIDIVRDNYWRKNPSSEKYHTNPAERYFIITPTWLRYTDLRVTPWDVTELQF